MYDTYLQAPYPRNCKKICSKAVKYFDSKISENEYIFEDNLFETIKCKLSDENITIEFPSISQKIIIFKKPVIFRYNNGSIEVFDEENLKKVLNDYNNEYLFYSEEKAREKNEILMNRPSEVRLIPKTKLNIEYLEYLNEKEDIPKNENTVSINACKLTTMDLNSLNVKRNENFEVAIKDRMFLFKILNEFLDSKYKILKIFGSDGIGKSISFLYYTHIKQKYKIIYFNLKELYIKLKNDQIDIMMAQLLSYFTCETQKNNNKIAEKIAFANFKDKESEIRNIILEYQEFDFWKILQRLISDQFFKDNTLIILDQYKTENDPNEKLLNIQNMLMTHLLYDSIKILISSSINDSGVKEDFELDLLALFHIYDNNNMTKDNHDNMIINNDLNTNEHESKLKEQKEPNTFNKLKNENYLMSESFNHRKNMIKNNLIEIIYISQLISAQNLTNEKREIITKMHDFNYNPKYYYKFKKYCFDNEKYFNIDELYTYFSENNYQSISKKIKNYYSDYYKNSKDTAIPMFDYILNIDNKINSEFIFTFAQLIEILQTIPLKYIKILKDSNNGNKKADESSNNFIIFNESVINDTFKLNYLYPFIKFVFSRLIFDLEKINLQHISPGGIGSILEKLIKKSLFTEKSYGEFNYRVVYSFINSITKVIENKKSGIDIFNFRKINYDDIKENLLVEKSNCYYICPDLSNNPNLDSIILIPPDIYNPNNMKYWLISLQITINKPGRKMKSLQEYHSSTIQAALLMERIYRIKIINKYFIFVLLKEYNNEETKKELIKEKIPYIYYSSIDKKFHFHDDSKIINIKQLIKDDYIINDKPIEKEIIAIKTGVFKNLQSNLNKKRKRNQNIDDIYSQERRKIFPDDDPIQLPEDVIKKLNKKMKTITKKEKNFQIRYAFVSPFYKIEGLSEDLFGLIFFKGNVFIYYDNKIYDINESKKSNAISQELEKYINEALNDKIKFSDEYGQSYKKSKEYDNLIKYYQYKPSSIYVYWIE